MRFSVFTTLLTVAGFVAGGVAAPAPDAASLSEQRRATGTSPVAEMAAAVSALNAQISTASAALKQNLTGVTASSPPNVLAGGQAAAAATFANLGGLLQQAAQNLTSQNQSAQKRQSSGAQGPDPSTGDLINAIQALVTEVIGLVNLALTSLGLGQFAGQVTGVLTVFGGLINSIAGVVVDVLPFLPDIASLVGAVGTLLSGIGSLIPKGA